MKRVGALSAVAWSLLAFVVLSAVQYGYIVYFFAQTAPGAATPRMGMQVLRHHGDVVAISTLVAMTTATLFLIGCVRGHGIALTEQWPVATRWRTLALWLAATVCLGLASDLANRVVRGSVVHGPSLDIYRSATAPAMVWIALVVCGPLFEEALFRGLLLPALAASRMRARWAVIATAVAWAVTHIQYNAFEMATLVLFGLLLGAARLSTGSITVPLAMHVSWNAVATAQIAYAAR